VQHHITVTNFFILLGFVEGLIKNADDKNELVQQAISESLHSLGNKHVELVLSSCLHFLVVNMRVIQYIPLYTLVWQWIIIIIVSKFIINLY